MSRFQNYLNDITKQAQEITSKNLIRAERNIVGKKKSQTKLSKKDISALRILREKAKIGLSKTTNVGFARLAQFGKTYKKPTEKEDYLKAKALDLLSQGTIKTQQFGSRFRRRANIGFDAYESSALERFLGANAGLATKLYRSGRTIVKQCDYLLSKDKMISLLSDKKNFARAGINEYQANYLKDIFSDEKLNNLIYTTEYTGKTNSKLIQGQKYFKLGTFQNIVNAILNNPNSKYAVKGFDYTTAPQGVGRFGTKQINDLELWKQEWISNYEKNNQSFKNILLLAAKENNLLNKYSDKTEMFPGLKLSGYNQLIAEAQANSKKMYDSLKVYLEKSSAKVDKRGKVSGVNVAFHYDNYLRDADKYSGLSEKAYLSALNELEKTLGLAEGQYTQSVKTQEDTIKQITSVLDSQKALNKPKSNVISSRRAALDAAVLKDRPTYASTTKKATFIERPS